MSPTATCAVCGRTILDGEHVHGYVSVDGAHEVCPLCAPRAEAAGWLPADQVDAEALPTPRRRGLFDRVLGRRRDAGGAEEWDAESAPEPVEPVTENDPVVAAADEAPPETPDDPAKRVFGWRRRPPAPDPAPSDGDGVEADLRPDPAGPGLRSRSRPRDEEDDGTFATISPFERAVARFNASEAGRTVTGLTRTLGEPSVSVGASAGGPQEVRITVAWELTWYQWGVDLADELRPVFQIAKGYEVDEIDAAARQWNAALVDGGRIVMGAPGGAAQRGDAVRR